MPAIYPTGRAPASDHAPTLTVSEWKPLRRATLLGFATVAMPDLIIHDVLVYESESGPWASPPGKPLFGKDGAPLRDAAGKARFTPIVSFPDRAARSRWSNAVIEALRVAYPAALDGDAS